MSMFDRIPRQQMNPEMGGMQNNPQMGSPMYGGGPQPPMQGPPMQGQPGMQPYPGFEDDEEDGDPFGGPNQNNMGGLLKFLKGFRGNTMPDRKMNIPRIEDEMYQYEGEGNRGWAGGSSGTNSYNEQLPNPGDYSEGY